MEKTQAQLKAEYLEELKNNSTRRNDPKMIDYCIKNAAYIVELEGGGLFEIEKPRIETNFCFWYRTDHTGEDYQRAQDAEDYARSNEKYFISENMEKINGRLEDLDSLEKYGETDRGGRMFLSWKRHGDKSECKITWFEFLGARNIQYIKPEEMAEKKEISKEDIKRLRAEYEQVKLQFQKRLSTYLKRYWLTKLNTWTYWADE